MIVIVLRVMIVVVIVVVAAAHVGIADGTAGALLDRGGAPQATDHDDCRQDGENDTQRRGYGKRWHLVIPS